VIYPSRSTCAFRRNNFRNCAERKMSYPTSAAALPNNARPAISTKYFSIGMAQFSLQLIAAFHKLLYETCHRVDLIFAGRR
jgi:hypothetical protein